MSLRWILVILVLMAGVYHIGVGTKLTTVAVRSTDMTCAHTAKDLHGRTWRHELRTMAHKE